MRKLLKVSVVLGVIAVAAGCSSNGVAVGARHGALSAYTGDIGSLNTPAYTLGDVVALDPQTHKAQRVTTAQIDPTDVTISQPFDMTAERFDSSFDLAFSQNVTPVMRTELSEAVSSQTVLHIESYFTRGIKDPAAFAVGSEQVAKAVAKWHKENPTAKFFLVSAVVPADKVYLSYSGSQPIRMGKYEFNVSYEQNTKLAKLAQEIPAFFKSTPLKVDQDSKGNVTVAVDKSFQEKLSDYDFSEAVASGW